MPRAPFAAAVAALTLLGAAPAAAQAPSAEAVKAAAALVDLQRPPQQAQAALDAQLKSMRSGADLRAQLSQDPRFRAEAAKNKPAFNSSIARMGALQADTLGPILRDMQPASRQAQIDAYARNFSATELEAIASFYRSPTGAKLRARERQMNADVQKVMAQKFGPRMEAAQKSVGPKIQAELQKLFPQGPGA